MSFSGPQAMGGGVGGGIGGGSYGYPRQLGSNPAPGFGGYTLPYQSWGLPSQVTGMLDTYMPKVYQLWNEGTNGLALPGGAPAPGAPTPGGVPVPPSPIPQAPQRPLMPSAPDVPPSPAMMPPDATPQPPFQPMWGSHPPLAGMFGMPWGRT